MDIREIYEAFHRMYDPSRILPLVDKIINLPTLPRQVSFLGEGARFRSYLMNMSGMELVVKIDQHTFDANFPKACQASWVTGINRLIKLGITGVPPMALLKFRDSYVVVMTYLADRPRSQAGIKNAENLEKVFSGYLETHGFKNNDLLQIGFVGDMPFVRDFSDIEEEVKHEDEGKKISLHHRRQSFRTRTP